MTARKTSHVSHSRLSLAMPPKRKAKSSGSDSDDPAPKKGKNSKGKATAPNPTASNQPTNKLLPVTIQFPPKKTASSVRISAWNVCGLAASQKKVRLHDAASTRLIDAKSGARALSTTSKLRTRISWCSQRQRCARFKSHNTLRDLSAQTGQ